MPPPDPVPSASASGGCSPRLSRYADLLERVLPFLFKLLILALAFLSNLFPLDLLPDGGWLLAQARWMYAHGAPVTANWFNYPLWGQPLVNEYVFCQLLLWPLWELHPLATSFFYATLSFTTVWLLFRLAQQHQLHPVWWLVAVTIAMVLLQYRFRPRPEMFGYLAVVVSTCLLWRHRDRPHRRLAELFRTHWPLLVLQVLWVNSHSSFVLGVVLVALWGGELFLRTAWREQALPWPVLVNWALLTLAMVACCLVTPQPLERALLPFHHQGSPPILAYVSEMHPLGTGSGDILWLFMLALLAMLTVTALYYRGISLTYLALTLLFFDLTLSSSRHATMFGLLALLALISCSLYGRPLAWHRRGWVRGVGILVLLLLWPQPLAVLARLGDPSSRGSLANALRAPGWDQTFAPIRAVDWIQRHDIRAPLLHRTEIGGYLQMQGLEAQTLADTGFGKYDEAFIYQICTLGERPALLGPASRHFRAPVAVVSNRAYSWPLALRQLGWRCVFFSRNGSVWMAPGHRPQFPALTPAQMETVWRQEVPAQPGPPVIALYQQLHLASCGLENVAIADFLAQPRRKQRTPLFWQGVARLVFPPAPGSVSEPAMAAFLPLAREVDPAGNGVTAVFRAQVMAHRGEWAQIVERYQHPPSATADEVVTLALAEAHLERQKPEAALKLLQSDVAFLPRNGQRYQLLARAYQAVGRPEDAGEAYRQALYFHPDDDHLQNEVEAFLLLHPLALLHESLKNARHVF